MSLDSLKIFQVDNKIMKFQISPSANKHSVHILSSMMYTLDQKKKKMKKEEEVEEEEAERRKRTSMAF